MVPVVLPFGNDAGKGPKSKIKLQVNPKKPKVNPEKGPEKKSKVTEEPHLKPIKETVKVPIVRSLSKSPSESPVSSIPSSPPSSPLALLVGPVAMGMVEEIKNALIESNRVAAMPIPQFYGKKGEKPEDHIMKVKDYFQNYNIRDREQKCNSSEILVVARLGHGCPP